MRRLLGGILVVLGALLVGLGLLAKPYLYPHLATVPLNQQSTSVSTGKDMDVLYPHRVGDSPALDKLTGVTVTSTRHVEGIPGIVKKAGKQGTDAFWQTQVRSQAVKDGSPVDLSYTDEGVSFNRKTGESTNCCGDYVSAGDLDDATKVDQIQHKGLFFKFPFDTQKRSYEFWDGTLSTANPISFKSEQNLFGTKVYVFEQVLPSQQVGTTTTSIPASAFSDGATGNVDATEMYSNTRTLWVEPVTGVLIKGQEQIKDVYEAAGYDPLAKTVGTIGFDDKTVKANAQTWGKKASQLALVKGPLTPIGLILGLLAIGGGAVLTFLRQPDPQHAKS